MRRLTSPLFESAHKYEAGSGLARYCMNSLSPRFERKVKSTAGKPRLKRRMGAFLAAEVFLASIRPS